MNINNVLGKWNKDMTLYINILRLLPYIRKLWRSKSGITVPHCIQVYCLHPTHVYFLFTSAGTLQLAVTTVPMKGLQALYTRTNYDNQVRETNRVKELETDRLWGIIHTIHTWVVAATAGEVDIRREPFTLGIYKTASDLWCQRIFRWE